MIRASTKEQLGYKRIDGPFSKYMTAQETGILVALISSVKPRVMIEFGCNTGATSKRVLDNVRTLEKYIGIDVPSHHVPTLGCQMSEVPLNPGFQAAGDERFFLLLAEAPTADMLEPCDAVFIDGDHSEDVVLRESQVAKQLLRSGGIVCWHDFNNPAVEVTTALRRLNKLGWPIHCVMDSWLAYMRV